MRQRHLRRSAVGSRRLTEALDAVHRAGYIHRDICPRNFIVSPDATSLKLIDFGLTLPIKREYLLPGNRTGTPLYMAPEIVRRKPTDLRVDIFALGVTAYQMWTFDFPWPSGDSTGTGALQHDSRAPTPITQYCRAGTWWGATSPVVTLAGT